MKTIHPTQQLRTPDIEPSESVLSEILKENYTVYRMFLDEMKTREIEVVWRYYTDGKAWLAKGNNRWIGKRGGLREKTLFWLSMWEGYFKVTLYVPENERDDILNLDLEGELLDYIKSIVRMGETFRTLPITFDITSTEQLPSLFKLIDYRKSRK